MSTVVVIPWKPGCAHRERILPWVIDWWGALGFDVVVGRCDGEWSKAVAVADGLSQSDADTLIVADADVVLADPDAIRVALDALVSHGWAVPHRLVHRLSEASTDAVLDGADWRGLPLSRACSWDSKPRPGRLGGGVTVITRALYDAVPLDLRFVGWGQEDESWAIALACLAGEPWHGDSDLVHLWHPPQRRKNRGIGSDRGKALRTAYEAAARDPMAMTALLREAP